MMTQNSDESSAIFENHLPAPLSFEEWEREAREGILKLRGDLDHWTQELHWFVNEPTHDGVPPSEFFRQEGICRRTRTVFLKAGNLHSRVYYYKKDTQKATVEGEWNIELAERIDPLFERAVEITEDWTEEEVYEREGAEVGEKHRGRPKLFKTNCTDRLKRVRDEWPVWCPAFARKLNGESSSGTG